MKKLTFFLVSLLVALTSGAIHAEDKSVRGALGWGFFAEVLWVLNHIEYAVANNKKPVAYWGENFAYYTSKGYEGKFNGWDYYFEPLSDAEYVAGDFLHKELYYNNTFSTLWHYNQYIENKYLCSQDEIKAFKNVTHQNFAQGTPYPNGGLHLYSQAFRVKVHKELIKKFIKIRPSIQTKINDFYDQNMQGKTTIAVHLRGKHIWGEVPFVSIEALLDEANKKAGPNVQFFIATDQYPLIEKARAILKGPVIYYECDRFSQTTSPVAGGEKLDPKLGEDLLIEAMLLARCDFFVHTISNVSTAVLYFNPTMKHIVLY